MSYEIALGPWGVDLDDAAYGRALAALGVGLAAMPRRSSLDVALTRGADAAHLRAILAAGRPTPWAISRILAQTPKALVGIAARHPAAAFAVAWAQAVGRPQVVDLPRLAIERFADEIGPYDWVADQLGQPDVLASASVVADDLHSDHVWRWPLRVGFLDDPAATSFRSRLHQDAWAAPLHRIVGMGDTDAADVLVLPGALPEALAALAALRTPLDIGSILVLGGLGGRSDMSLSDILGSARLNTRAWGLAVADVPEGAADTWLSSLLYNLAHDVTLDVALHAALVEHGRVVLFADPASLAGSTVTAAASRMASALAPAGDQPPPVATEPPPVAAEPPPVTAEPPPPPEPGPLPGLESFGLPPQMSTEDLVAAATDPANYRHEVHGATATAALDHRMRAQRRARRPAVESRYIQVEIREGPRFVGAPRRTAIAPNAAHAIDIWVGPPTGAIRGRAPLPEKDLPNDHRPIRLTVVFAELDGKRRTQTGTLDLPPTGTRRSHRFFFLTGPADHFRARIIVSYRNRILQTALLNAPVAAKAQAGPGRARGRIVLRTEAEVRPGLASLRNRRQFGVAIVHNHDGAGSPGGTVVGSGHAVPLQLGDIGRTVDTITGLLSGAAEDPASYGPTLDADATVALLFKLAQQGVLLREDLLGRSAVADLLKGAERIQILSASANDILPLEFAYDFPAPVGPPRLCPNAKQALLDGHCDGRQHHEQEDGNLDVVCPAGFWAITRVIERHIADPDALARDGRGAPYELANEPIKDRDRLTGLTGAVFAASAKVDLVVPGSSALVETALSEMTGGRSARAATWLDWVRTVKASTPSLLVLLAHSVRDDATSMTALEIETDERRDAAAITSRYVRPDGAGPAPPLVFLLGCDTAVADLQYQTFVSRFRQVGAAIVVGTISTVAGSHAAGVAASLIRAVKRSDDSDWRTFGELLREVRRGLLLEGEVMALCLTAYGDADWRFPGGRTDVTSIGAHE
jgi:hypothetical protein